MKLVHYSPGGAFSLLERIHCIVCKGLTLLVVQRCRKSLKSYAEKRFLMLRVCPAAFYYALPPCSLATTNGGELATLPL